MAKVLNGSMVKWLKCFILTPLTDLLINLNFIGFPLSSRRGGIEGVRNE